MKRDIPTIPSSESAPSSLMSRRVLLVRRATEPLKGEWSVPGGMLELGEKLRTASAARCWRKPASRSRAGEVLDVFDSIFTDDQGRTQYHYVLIDYLCRQVSGEAKAGTDVSEVRWVSETGLSQMGLRDVTEQVMRKGIASARKIFG